MTKQMINPADLSKEERERRKWSTDPRDKYIAVATIRFPDHALHKMDVPGFSSRREG